MNFGDTRLPERFWEKVFPEPNTGCWLWGAGADKWGYGRYNHKRVGRRAYWVSFTELVGPVPNGLELDHVCNEAACVNPNHLQPVTKAENVGRALRRRYEKPKTHCKRGHEFTEENTRPRKDGGRDCKKCDVIRGRAYEERKKLAS